MDAAVDDFEPERHVSALRGLVVGPSIGGDLAAALLSAPCFRGANERAADASAPMLGLDVPALDEADRSSRIAPVGVRTEPDFYEPDGPGFVVCDEYDEW